MAMAGFRLCQSSALRFADCQVLNVCDGRS
jgi:hypothetical protein